MNASRGIEVGAARSRVNLTLFLALLTVYVIWGSTYLAMRIAVAALPPWGMAGTRFLAAGLGALAIARFRGAALPTRADWLRALPAGFGLFFIGNGFIAVAEQTLPSSLCAVAAATTPLLAAAMNAARGERPRRAELLGMLVGLAGVVVLMGSSLRGGGWRSVLVALAPVGFALGSLLVRARGKGGSALAVAAPQMIAGGAAMLGTSLVLGERFPGFASLPLGAAAAWLYLVVAGSLVGFTAYAWLLRHARPAVAMSYAYVNPIVAVLLGAALGGEHLGPSTVVAAALIASGVMLATALRRA